MSGFRDKKKRTEELTTGMTDKQLRLTAQEKKNRQSKMLYIALTAVLCIAFVVLLVYNTGLIQRSVTAVTIGDKTYTAPQVQFYYQTAYNQFVNNNSQWLTYLGLDTSKPLETQNYDETTTWADYFRKQGLSLMQETIAMADEARAEGHEMSQDARDAIEALKTSVTQYCVEHNITKSTYYGYYGNYMTESIYMAEVENTYLSQDYAASKLEKMEYDDSTLASYYEEHKDDFDVVTYRTFFIDGAIPDTTDENGNAVAATDEEVAAKKAEAKAQADQMAARLAAGEGFAALAEEYKADDSTVDYTQDAATLYSDVKKANISSAYSEWLFDAARTAGENTVVESGTGYYVVQFLSRTRNDYNTVNIRHILFAPVLDEDSGTATEEQLAEAKSRAEAVLATWESGEKTADAFSALALEHSDDEDTKDGGGLLEQVYKGDTANDLTDWIFADGRAVGDWALLQSNDGYHIMYVDSFGVPYWKLEVKSTLRQADYNAWIEELREKYPLGEEGFGMKFVG